MQMKNKNYQSGFTAILTTSIISIVLLNLAITTNLKIFWLRTNSLFSELKNSSAHLAEACADTTILKILKDSNYMGNESVTIDNQTCDVKNVTTNDLGNNSLESTFKVKSKYQNAFSNLEIKIKITDTNLDPKHETIYWREVP